MTIRHGTLGGPPNISADPVDALSQSPGGAGGAGRAGGAARFNTFHTTRARARVTASRASASAGQAAAHGYAGA